MKRIISQANKKHLKKWIKINQLARELSSETSQEAIAKHFGISRQAVQQHMTKEAK